MATSIQYVSISLEEYAELQDAAAMLSALHAAGVDNWEGYSEAITIYEEEQS